MNLKAISNPKSLLIITLIVTMTILCLNMSIRAEAWNISTYVYDSVSISTQDSTPLGIFFKSDGTKMYEIGSDNDKVYQYTCSSAWSLSTCTYDSVSISTQDDFSSDLFFSSDGTKLYEIGYEYDKFYQYSCSLAWDLSSCTYDSVSISSQGYPLGIFFKPDGTKLYEMGFSGSNYIYQYTCSSAWSLSTCTYDSVSISMEDSDSSDLFFSSDGTKLYEIGYGNDLIYQYTCSSAWDLSSCTYDSVNLSVQDTTSQDLFFSSDGTILYTVGSNDDKIYQYSIPNTVPSITIPSLNETYLFEGTVLNITCNGTDDDGADDIDTVWLEATTADGSVFISNETMTQGQSISNGYVYYKDDVTLPDNIESANWSSLEFTCYINDSAGLESHSNTFEDDYVCMKPRNGLQLNGLADNLEFIFCNDTYELDDTGITILTDDAILICNDTVIDGNKTEGSIGINVNNDNIGIYNCSVTDFFTGIMTGSISNNVSIYNADIVPDDTHPSYGINFGGNDNWCYDCHVHSGGGTSFHAANAVNVHFIGGTAEYGTNWAVYFNTVNDSSVENVTILDKKIECGGGVDSSRNITFSGNILTNSTLISSRCYNLSLINNSINCTGIATGTCIGLGGTLGEVYNNTVFGNAMSDSVTIYNAPDVGSNYTIYNNIFNVTGAINQVVDLGVNNSWNTSYECYDDYLVSNSPYNFSENVYDTYYDGSIHNGGSYYILPGPIYEIVTEDNTSIEDIDGEMNFTLCLISNILGMGTDLWTVYFSSDIAGITDCDSCKQYGIDNMGWGAGTQCDYYEEDIFTSNGDESNYTYNGVLNSTFSIVDGYTTPPSIIVTETQNIIGGQCVGGNYYRNYLGIDADYDGIGDVAYTVNATTSIYDYLPLTNNNSGCADMDSDGFNQSYGGGSCGSQTVDCNDANSSIVPPAMTMYQNRGNIVFCNGTYTLGSLHPTNSIHLETTNATCNNTILIGDGTTNALITMDMNSMLQNCIIEGNPTHAIVQAFSNNTVFRNNTLRNFDSEDSSVLVFFQPNNVTSYVYNNSFDNLTTSSNVIRIIDGYNFNLNLYNNTFSDISAIPVSIENITGNVNIYNNTFDNIEEVIMELEDSFVVNVTNNIMNNSLAGIEISSKENFGINNSEISNNIIKYMEEDCLSVENSYNTIIVNNSISNCLIIGSLFDSVENFTIINNNITNSSSTYDTYIASNQYLTVNGIDFNNEGSEDENTTLFAPFDVFDGGETCYVDEDEYDLWDSDCDWVNGTTNLSIIAVDLSDLGDDNNVTTIVNGDFESCEDVDDWFMDGIGSTVPCYFACILYISNGEEEDYTFNEDCFNETVNITEGLTYSPYVDSDEGRYYGITLLDVVDSIIYNNYFNNEYNAYDDGTNDWNTSYDCTGTNILGGDCIGGNYYSDYADCYTVDRDNDGIGEQSYEGDSFTDYLPLDYSPPITQSVCGELNQANKIYELDGNVVSTGTCFNVTANCIWINGMGYNVTFGNSTSNREYGIKINGYNDTWIFNLTFTQGNTIGNYKHIISLNNTWNVSVFNNTMDSFSPHGYGISAISNVQSTNVTIENNIINLHNTTSHGVFMSNVTNSKISNNIMTSDVNGLNNIGIDLINGANHTEISNNTIDMATIYSHGIYIHSTYNSTIANNTVRCNSSGFGIYLYNGDNNTIYGNTFKSLLTNAIRMFVPFDSTHKNLIYNNIFNGSNVPAYVTGSYSWLNTTKALGTNIIGGSYIAGNYWTNKNGNIFPTDCVDLNSDGICDSAYTIDNNNIDYLPLVQSDSTNPFVNITSPPNGSILNGIVIVNVNATDDNAIYSVELYIKNSTMNWTLMDTDTSYPYGLSWDTYEYSNTTEGYQINATAIDIGGNSNSSLRTYFIDHIIPQVRDIVTDYPNDQTSVKDGDDVILSVNCSDGQGVSAGYNTTSVDLTDVNTSGEVAMSFVGGSQNPDEWSEWNLTVTVSGSTGIQYAQIYSRDNVTPTNNVNNASYFSVHIDNEVPTYDNFNNTPTSPSNGSAVNFYVDLYDNYDLRNYTFESNVTGVWVNESVTISGNANYSALITKTMYTGNYSYRFYVFDDAGNMNVTGLNNLTVLGNPSYLNVFLIEPNHSANFSYSEINFTYWYMNGTARNCTLYIDNVENGSTEFPENMTTNYFLRNISDGYHSWYVSCLDNVTGEVFDSDSRDFFVDTLYPQYSNVYPPDGYYIEYEGMDQDHEFNCTWTDAFGIDTVILEFNGINHTVTTKNGDEYYHSVRGNDFGRYYLRWYANDTVDNRNMTPSYEYNILNTEAVGGGAKNLTYDTYSEYIKYNISIKPSKYSDLTKYSKFNITITNLGNIDVTLDISVSQDLRSITVLNKKQYFYVKDITVYANSSKDLMVELNPTSLNQTYKGNISFYRGIDFVGATEIILMERIDIPYEFPTVGIQEQISENDYPSALSEFLLSMFRPVFYFGSIAIPKFVLWVISSIIFIIVNLSVSPKRRVKFSKSVAFLVILWILMSLFVPHIII